MANSRHHSMRESDQSTSSDENLELHAKIEALGAELARLQRAAQSAHLPIVIMVEGWEAAGKGTLINSLSQFLDSRGFRVVSVRPAAEQDPYFPPQHRFILPMPEAGRITIYDRSWYSDLWAARAQGKAKRKRLAAELRTIHQMEAMLTAGGNLILKFFLGISQKEQTKRFRRIERSQYMRWRLDENDWHQNRHFNDWQKAANEVLFADLPAGVAPFEQQDSSDKRTALVRILESAIQAIGKRLNEQQVQASTVTPATSAAIDLPPASDPHVLPLARVDLNQKLSREEYETLLPELQARLKQLEHRIYKERVPVVICCEGWDAAGKGGAIRRLVSGLDPRGYDVHPISAPNDVERRHHYLWRFWTRIPKAGHIAVFDRTWYGRVLVERIEGFCSPSDWQRAFGEIADFEQNLVSYGTVLVKFWFHIDPNTQLARFNDRESNPDKQWKITQEDWRNRNRWSEYETAVNDMLRFNNTDACPYWVVPANDKLFSRVFVLRTVVSAIENALDKQPR